MTENKRNCAYQRRTGKLSPRQKQLLATSPYLIKDHSQPIDKKIFNVGRDLSSSGGTGTDVLRKVPSVDVDIDGVVTIAGDANVTVLIDGKRVEEPGAADVVT